MLVAGVAGAQITEIIDGGAVKHLYYASGVAVDGLGNVYVTGNLSDNAFRIPEALTPVELLSLTVE